MAVDITDVPPVSTGQSINNPSATTLSSGNVVAIALADAATNTAPDILTLSHATSGTAAAGFGETIAGLLQSAAGVIRRATEDVLTYTTATNAAEVAQRVFRLINAGTLRDVLTLSGGNSAAVIASPNTGVTTPILTIQSTDAGAGQATITFKTGSTVRGGYRADTAGNVSMSTGSGGNFTIYVGGDFGVGTSSVDINGATGRVAFKVDGIGFNGAAIKLKPAITGSRGGNAALASLLTELASYGLITDSTSA